ncbi:hypothetical protein [Polaribacter ponticola]|uniref:hypothetical protein n=1 Tax=Polaribacter ponticola TaxID=2978475 RepID=UPI0030823006
MSLLISEVEKYIFNLFNDKLDVNYTYHNLVHTQKVVEKVLELSEDLKLDETSIENLQIAAWFHDSGFIYGANKHENESIKILKIFLKIKI